MLRSMVVERCGKIIAISDALAARLETPRDRADHPSIEAVAEDIIADGLKARGFLKNDVLPFSDGELRAPLSDAAPRDGRTSGRLPRFAWRLFAAGPIAPDSTLAETTGDPFRRAATESRLAGPQTQSFRRRDGRDGYMKNHSV